MVHIFVFINTSQPYSFCLGAHQLGKAEGGGGRSLSPMEGKGLTPRDLLSGEGHQASILTPVSSS